MSTTVVTPVAASPVSTVPYPATIGGHRQYVLTTDGTTDAGTVSVVDPTVIGTTGANAGAILGTVAAGQGGSAIAVDPTGRVYVTNAPG